MKEIVANDKLGAFCRHTHVEVAGAADGPLHKHPLERTADVGELGRAAAVYFTCGPAPARAPTRPLNGLTLSRFRKT